MSAVREAFERARRSSRGALVAYLMGGDPDLDRSLEYAAALVRGGADILEIGLPFSDPVADGPVIQEAARRALAAGTTPAGILGLVRRLRERTAVPILVMTYYNPVFAFGEERFVAALRDAGGSGLLVPDLPAEESDGLRRALDAAGLDLVQLVTPATGRDRAAGIARKSSGFLYLVSRYGTTGDREFDPQRMRNLLASAREGAGGLPVAVGFGIARPKQVADVLLAGADGAVVGSAFVERIARRDTPADLEAFAHDLAAGLVPAVSNSHSQV